MKNIKTMKSFSMTSSFRHSALSFPHAEAISFRIGSSMVRVLESSENSLLSVRICGRQRLSVYLNELSMAIVIFQLYLIRICEEHSSATHLEQASICPLRRSSPEISSLRTSLTDHPSLEQCPICFLTLLSSFIFETSQLSTKL